MPASRIRTQQHANISQKNYNRRLFCAARWACPCCASSEADFTTETGAHTTTSLIFFGVKGKAPLSQLIINPLALSGSLFGSSGWQTQFGISRYAVNPAPFFVHDPC